MEVTLKKAADLARAAGEAAEKIRVDATQKLSIYAASNPDVSTLRVALQERIGNSMALLHAKFAIRSLIGEANAQSGVSSALTEREMVDAQIKRLGGFADTFETAEQNEDAPEIAFAAASSLLERMNRAEKVGPYVTTDVTFRVADETMIKELRSQILRLKRQRSEITDRVAGINLNVMITLPVGVTHTLRTNGLID